MSATFRFRFAAKYAEICYRWNIQTPNFIHTVARSRACYVKSLYVFPFHQHVFAMRKFSEIATSTFTPDKSASVKPEVSPSVSLSNLLYQAETGNVTAQFNLGLAHLNGHHGLKPSPKEAIPWFKRFVNAQI